MQSVPYVICPLCHSGSLIYVKRVVRRRWKVGRGGEGRGGEGTNMSAASVAGFARATRPQEGIAYESPKST